MKYIVLTTKHHDGFCLWDTEQTDYNIMNSPFKRGCLQGTGRGLQEAGHPFCTYHSVTDWWHPAHPYGSPGGRTRKRQCRHRGLYGVYPQPGARADHELRPLGLMWFDVPQGFDRIRGQAA